MRTLWTIFSKELQDTLRDRRTLMIMIFVPLLLIPVILSLTTSLTKGNSETIMKQIIRMAITSNDNGKKLVDDLKLRKDILILENIKPYKYNQLIREDSLDIALIIPSDFDQQLERWQTVELEVRFNATQDSLLYQRIRTTLDRFEGVVLQNRLDSLKASRESINPIDVSLYNVYSTKESLGKMAGGLLPYFFVLFCLFGAMYPAIDLFTGEKERGTIETILSMPVSRLQILLGKMGVIALSGLLSGLLTILGIFVALQINPDLPQFLKSIVLQLLNPGAIFLVIAMMIPLAVFFAGLLIPICVYAKSFKEAQSIIQPLTFVVIVPLIAGILPEVQLNFLTALVPILNIALATREIIAGTISTSYLVIVFFSLLAFAALGILLSIRKFGSEKNLLRS